MDIRPQSSDELDSQRRVRRDMSNSLKGTLLTVVAGIAWGVVRNEWPIPNGTRNFGSGLD